MQEGVFVMIVKLMLCASMILSAINAYPNTNICRNTTLLHQNIVQCKKCQDTILQLRFNPSRGLLQLACLVNRCTIPPRRNEQGVLVRNATCGPHIDYTADIVDKAQTATFRACGNISQFQLRRTGCKWQFSKCVCAR